MATEPHYYVRRVPGLSAVLVIIAAIIEVLAAFNVGAPIGLVPLGLAVFMLAFI